MQFDIICNYRLCSSATTRPLVLQAARLLPHIKHQFHFSRFSPHPILVLQIHRLGRIRHFHLPCRMDMLETKDHVSRTSNVNVKTHAVLRKRNRSNSIRCHRPLPRRFHFLEPSSHLRCRQRLPCLPSWRRGGLPCPPLDRRTDTIHDGIHHRHLPVFVARTAQPLNTKVAVRPLRSMLFQCTCRLYRKRIDLTLKHTIAKVIFNIIYFVPTTPIFSTAS